MPGRVPNHAYQLNELTKDIGRIFDQAQTGVSNHQKNIIALYKLHTKAVNITEPHRNGVKMVGEKRFKEAILDMINRILSEKRGVTPADKIVKFIGRYFGYLNEKATSGTDDEDDKSNMDMDTAASRFTESVIEYILENGCEAKDKVVRYRSVQICAEVVLVLGEIDEDIYQQLLQTLLERLSDKEANVRAQAAIALCKFARTEEDGRLREALIDSLAHDTSSDVRKAILVNIPLSEASLSAMIRRTRDTDAIVRKLAFSHALATDCENPKSLTHPTKFTIAQRELICRNGFGDRETAVRNAAGDLLEGWIRALRVKHEDESTGVEQVTALLQKFDLAEGKVASEALLGVFERKPRVFESIDFGETFWGSLTPEKAFLVRVFVEHCDAIKDTARKEEALPEVTALVFHIKRAYERLFTLIRDEEVGDIEHDDKTRTERGDEKDDYELVVEELLKLAVRLDYQDEMGRKEMEKMIKGLFTREGLPDKHLPICLDVFRVLSSSEGDLILQVVEIITTMRDPPEEEVEEPITEDPDASFEQEPSASRVKSREEMTPAEIDHDDHTAMVCLTLLEGCLERVEGAIYKHPSLDGVRKSLVLPCAFHTKAALREKGYRCLALMSLIDRSMAVTTIRIFLDHIQRPHTLEESKHQLLEFIFDLLMAYPRLLFDIGKTPDEFTTLFVVFLEHEKSERIQALLCMGLAKLALSGILVNDKLVRSLVIAFFTPSTANNQTLRQCLAYFIPMFCWSGPQNQALMKSHFLETFSNLCDVRRTKDDEDGMVTMLQIGSMFAEWTRPEHVIESKGNSNLQYEMGLDILYEIGEPHYLKDDNKKEHRKVLFQLLPKLYLPDDLGELQIVEMHCLATGVRDCRLPRDAVAKNAFARFEANFAKKYEEHLQDFDESQYRRLESLNKLFAFVDNMVPMDDDEDAEPVEKKGRKRRSMSVVSTTTDDGEDLSNARTTRGRSKPKKRRVSTSDDEDSYDEDGTERGGSTPPQSSAPTRTLPKRAATRKPAPEPTLDMLADQYEEDDDDVETTPKVSNRTTISQATTDDEEERQPNLSATTLANDSLFDDDDEEEEDEVSGLLVED
ncbi:chromosome condensation complex Condensin, subunit G [Marasmius crinis-equi]|uniref:Chromosome condensation complex Condensin, subunit G n=1 Tax=Marasmius crinis-equi TaxID=585013 RepID=A0ABR3FUL3_9AGAR